MSKEAAADFLVRVNSDPAMQDQIRQLDKSSGFDEIQDFAAIQGYNFSLDELVAAGREQIEAGLIPEAELSEADLEAVAGGALNLGSTIKHSTVRNSLDSLNINLDLNLK